MAVVLSGNDAFEFKPLFTMVKLRAGKAANGGEEMLRLRMYEKLQNLVGQGVVEKTRTKSGKEYRGLASLASALPVVSPLVA